ncbi:MAG TPA: amidase [Acidimicrobiales bacterium]|nr:amidase [Acidimicrobiales bacterium]
MDFRTTAVADLADEVRARRVSAVELVAHALERIDALNPTINAFVAVDGERALADAAALDARAAAGEDVGPLAGIPIGVKDLEDAAGFVTSHGSPLFLDDPTASNDSALVTRLRAAGAIVVGKTNTPELGWTAQTFNDAFGTTRNPWDTSRTPGGSSGGSAAAIASGMVPLTTGSDGGGSIRIPSALCGLSGLKPSLGRVPSGGAHAPDWQHLSTKGPMARRTTDLALALDAVIGPDPTDLRSLPMPDPSWLGAVTEPHVPIKVAWSPTLGYGSPDPKVVALCEEAVRAFEAMGAEVVVVDKVFDADPVISWFSLAAVYNLRTLQSRRDHPAWERVDVGLRAQLDFAERVTALQMVEAEDECHRLNLRLVELFHDVRLLVCPVTAAPTPRCGELGEIAGVPSVNWVQFTYPFNMTRSPAGTVCAGFDDAGMPVGLQLVGPQHGDLAVLRAMAALETALAIDRVPPTA